MSEDVYHRLQLYFDTFPLGFPTTETGVEIRLLKKLFTPKEAEIALKVTYGHWGSSENFDHLDKIYERVKDLGFSFEEVEKHLDNMVSKGAIIRVKRNGKKSYANTLLVLGIYEHQVDKITKEFLDDFYEYLSSEDWRNENRAVKTPQMRTIPVGIKFEYDNPIAKYDDIKSIFEEAEGPFSIINCICRQSQDLLNDPCKLTDRREVCLTFGGVAQIYIDSGFGREITKEEAIENLKQNEEEGLIFRPGNTQEMDFVCSCCYCCCGAVADMKKMPNPADYVTNNYVAHVNDELCTGCGICVDRCQLDAITIENDVSTINPKRCIGCGNCILKCPEKAIALKSKEKQKIPPATFNELYDIIRNERESGKKSEMTTK
ncbi:MAG: 4Fe-4S binding protein [Candidatus Heimdallarchaeota archaeon]|nr:4Fe-4S binding protein [Candidatus Heimdallarchaeota archaeon]